MELNEIDKYKMSGKCQWYDEDKAECQNGSEREFNYCKCHLFVHNYTDEMKEKSRICEVCHNFLYIAKQHKICDKCRKGINRNIEIESNSYLILKNPINNKIMQCD